MAPERDLFANFQRMRRKMDELFGGVIDRGRLIRGGSGFSPPVDVYYCGDPPRAVVKAELAGIEADDLALEVRGRELIITGLRRAADAEGRVYQQLEIEHGPFRRVIALGADVQAGEARATYDDGILRIEIPLVAPGEPRSVPIETPAREGEP
ncbi:MAG: Hsp20/alpha crystallin family protein [Solirubrobacteraceae bacterium]